MTDLVALKAANERRWANARLTRAAEFARPARTAFASKVRYLAIARRAGMPDIGWVFIAVSHYRESSQDFAKNLGQGDPLDRVTTRVPAGRGPFTGLTAFEDAAVDALVSCAPFAARLTDWSIGGMLTNLERYNGLKYANAGRPSAYIWAGTTIYDPPTGPGGKVLVDHGPIEDWKNGKRVVDVQLGCAGLILAIMAIDASVRFDGPPPRVSVPQATVPATTPAAPVLDAVWLQTSLNRLGTTPQLVVDGIIGAGTRTAIRAFQTSKDLAVDGLAGPQTIAAIQSALAGKPGAPTKPAPPSIGHPAKGSIGAFIFDLFIAIFRRK